MKIKKIAASLSKAYDNVIDIFLDEVFVVTNSVITGHSLRSAFQMLLRFIVVLLFIKQVCEKLMGMSSADCWKEY